MDLICIKRVKTEMQPRLQCSSEAQADWERQEQEVHFTQIKLVIFRNFKVIKHILYALSGLKHQLKKNKYQNKTKNKKNPKSPCYHCLISTIFELAEILLLLHFIST